MKNEDDSEDMKAIKTIFLIEDDEMDAHFFTEAVNDVENALLCDTATNGLEALRKLQNAAELPDIIFSDIQMPKMDGIACLAELKKNAKFRHIPVIMLSTNIASIDMVRSIGACAFIKKPDSIAQLKQQIQAVIHLDYTANMHVADFTFETASLH